ncbi:uncharacterized protein METZ01_LOCUS61507 [marine metagenome]|uniref:DNA 3'-5' helicase n=1 Tax=marine metagenome TaxID=408172 RepID=A0A381T4K9_9ZZZZ
MAKDSFTELNPPQRKAVETIDGPLLIMAGPGSGKTRVITSRIAYLVKNCGVSPHRIAAVTFTNKAAKEMQARLQSLLGHGIRGLTSGTFHSFCAKTLRIDGEQVGLGKDFVIFDDDDQINTIKRGMKEVDIDPKRFSPRSILSTISNAKSQLLGLQEFVANKSNYYDEIVSRVFERYEEILQQSNAADFDDLLLKTHTLFDTEPEVLKKYQERFLYLMVDEFQDTNIAQYNIAKQIAEKHKNLCVVGDPDQSIYSWRNADIRNILSFQSDFSQAEVISLEENYRSTQTILDGAKNLIASNKERVNKDLWTKNVKGSPITVMEGYNEEEEAQLVIREIGRYVDSGNYVLGDISVMYRVNAQSRAFEMACQRYGVPYQVVGGIKFYQRREVKDLIAYLRLILNPHDDISLSRVINVPTRGIGQRTMDELTRMSVTLNLPIFSVIENLSTGDTKNVSIPIQLGARAIKAVEDFKNLIDNLRNESENLDLVELIDSVITRTGFRRHLESNEQSEERIENIQEFRSSAREYAQLKGQEALIAFMESIALVSDLDGLEEDLDFITLITLHQAKGLEFPVVFITGMEEGLLPHIRSIDTGDPRELEEERRLCYVGMTRAKERLHLIRAFRRGFRGGSEPSAPSRFLSEIPRELVYIPGHTENESIETSHQDNTIRSLANPPVKNNRQSFGPSRSGTSHSSRSSSGKNPPAERVRLPGLKHRQSQKVVPVRRRRIVNKIIAPNLRLSFKTGDKVKHASFGEGIVLNFEPSGDDVQVTVVFKESIGVKKLMAGVAKLEKL